MSRKLDLSGLAAKAESGNNSSVRRIETLNMNIDELLLEEPFKSLFPIRDQVRSAIRSHMQEHGYDESKPVDVWKRATQDGFEYVLVDGFTRARAAKEIGRLTVMAYLHDFASVEEARDYAIHTQRDRRNLSDAEIMSVLSAIDKKMTGFKRNLPIASSDATAEPSPKTAQRTAREIGTSTRKVEKARKVDSDVEIAAAVKRGELSINKGYNTIRAREKAASALGGGEPVLEKPKEEPTPTPSLSVDKPIDFNVLVDRLSTKLGVEVDLALEGTGESGRVSFCFANRGELARVVEKICSSGSQPVRAEAGDDK
jgi:ParB family chromosome partitioning protein